MRTSIDLSDALLSRVRAHARRQRTTLKAVVEHALDLYLKQEAPRGSFRLRDAAFAGDGLAEGVSEGDWERIRDLAYEGRGS